MTISLYKNTEYNKGKAVENKLPKGTMRPHACKPPAAKNALSIGNFASH
jgi:hypothetical protein